MSASDQGRGIAVATHAILRLSVCMCFVGHGAFGLRQKVDWLVFFDRFFIPEYLAFRMMPFIGCIDIVVGILVLIYPARALLLYAAVWGTFTALLRPIVGMPIFEAIERAGNVGPALALLVTTGPGWLASARVLSLDDPRRARVTAILRWTTGLLLIGHGGLAAGGKPGLLKHWRVFGVPAPDVAGFVRTLGFAEIATGVVVLRFAPAAACILIAIWKMANETLFLSVGDPFWEWIERGGSYGAPLALALLVFARPAVVPAQQPAPATA